MSKRTTKKPKHQQANGEQSESRRLSKHLMAMDHSVSKATCRSSIENGHNGCEKKYRSIRLPQAQYLWHSLLNSQRSRRWAIRLFPAFLFAFTVYYIREMHMNFQELPRVQSLFQPIPDMSDQFLGVNETKDFHRLWDDAASANCSVANAFQSRQRWLTQTGGYILIHHVRRAGGSALCKILLSPYPNHPLRDSNCLFQASAVVGSSLADRYSLRRLGNTKALEQEMDRQGTTIVAIEGFELPPWFLEDEHRSERWTIVTSMRDPVDRLVSMSRAKCPLRPEWCWSTPVDSGTKYPYNNVMTRMFAGAAVPGGLGDAERVVTEDDLALAIRTLETNYQLIFITEWIPEMTPIFKYWFGMEAVSGLQRPGFGGKHDAFHKSQGRSVPSSSHMGPQRAARHYIPESSGRHYLHKIGRDDLYEEMRTEHELDRKLVQHFRARERWRAMNCFLFRMTNLPQEELSF